MSHLETYAARLDEERRLAAAWAAWHRAIDHVQGARLDAADHAQLLRVANVASAARAVQQRHADRVRAETWLAWRRALVERCRRERLAMLLAVREEIWRLTHARAIFRAWRAAAAERQGHKTVLRTLTVGLARERFAELWDRRRQLRRLWLVWRVEALRARVTRRRASAAAAHVDGAAVQRAALGAWVAWVDKRVARREAQAEAERLDGEWATRRAFRAWFTKSTFGTR